MNRRYRTLILSLALTLVVALLAGCGGNNNSSGQIDDSSQSSEEGGIAGKTITLITSDKTYEGQAEAYEAAVQAFNEETGANMQVMFQGQWTDLIQTLQAARISGETYDMTSVGSGNLHQSIAKSGLVMDITEIVEPLTDRFVGDSLSHHTIGGHVFGIPCGTVSTMGVFYNKTMIEELGFSLENGYTYEDLKEICEAVKAEYGITPIIHDGASWWWWPSWFFFTYTQESGNNSEAEIEAILRGERSWVEDDVIAAFNDIQMFFDDGLIGTESLETDTEAASAIFAQQQAAFYFCTATNYVKFGGADFDISFVSYPVIVEGAIPQSSGGADEGMNILTLGNPDNLDACAAALEYLTRPEVAGPMFEPTQNFGFSIVGVDGYETPVSDAAFELFTDYTIMYLDWYWAAEHNDAVVAAIQGLTTGEYDGEAAAQYVQDAYDVTVEQNDYVYDWWDTWTEEDWAAVTPSYIPEINVG